jgi:hypothetical protein
VGNPMAVVSGMKHEKLMDTRIRKYHMPLRSLRFASVVKHVPLIVKKFALNYKVRKKFALNFKSVCP